MEKNPLKNPFFVLIAILTVFNLLSYNDWIHWLSPGELTLLGDSQQKGAAWLPWLIQNGLYDAGINPFLVRLPSVLLFILSLFGIYKIGRPLFGTIRIMNALLVLSVSWLVLPLAKLASADILLFAGLSLSLLSALRYLKEGSKTWRQIHFGFLILAFWVNPWVTAISLVLFDLSLYFGHKDGKKVLDLWHFIIIPLVLLTTWMSVGLDFPHQWFFADVLDGKIWWIIGWQFIGVLPFWGFLFAGLWQVFKNSRKGEEWSGLMLSLILAGLCFAPLLQLAFALVIARSLNDFAHPNYPFRPIVRAFALIGLVLVFCIGAVAMLNGFYYLQGQGFRAAMAVCISFWIPYFFSIVGLWSLREGQFRNMAVIAGGLSFFFILVQGVPLFEKLSGWERDIPEKVSDAGFEAIRSNLEPGETLQFYLNENKLAFRRIAVSDLPRINYNEPVLVDSLAIKSMNTERWQIDTFPALDSWYYLLMPEE
ncbi:MAG: glycosyltransferase family 39 protein [Bacteroidetes bacterium]|nr:glycosyltransferase family 39 protein [Bacteroidota bacterium]